MAGLMTWFYGKPNADIVTLVCDTTAEVEDAPTTQKVGTGVFADYQKTIPIGSELLVGNESGKLLVYMLFSFGWKCLNPDN